VGFELTPANGIEELLCLGVGDGVKRVPNLDEFFVGSPLIIGVLCSLTYERIDVSGKQMVGYSATLLNAVR
jgi:hypothetical protein